MASYAIGLIEVVGLLAAVEASDTALKSANVKLLSCEDATGAMFTVKIYGDVGAVNAAISAAAVAAARVGKVVSTLVLPRPAKGIYHLLDMAEEPDIARPPVEQAQPQPEPPVSDVPVPTGLETPKPKAKPGRKKKSGL